MSNPNRPLHRTVMNLESYIAYTPPIVDTVENAERGLDVAYADQWGDEIFMWLSSGRTLVSYCQQPQKPARSLVLSWLNHPDQRYDHLRDRFEKGLINRAIALVDEAGDVAEEPLMMTAKGGVDLGAMADKKSRFDAKLRLAALLDPTKFAPLNKSAQSIQLNQVNLTKNNVVEMTDEQLLRVLTELERKKHGPATSDIVVGPTSGDSSEGIIGSPKRPLLPG